MNQIADQKTEEAVSGRDGGVITMESHSSHDDMRSPVSSPTVNQNSISDGGQLSSTPIESPLSSWSDDRLWNSCRYYGEQARRWRNRFAGLLPEVFRRRLYEKKGFESIFVFAFKLGGLSENQVKTALRIDDFFHDKPALRELFQSGEVGLAKLDRITSIATKENDQILSVQARILPKSALETFVRDEKLQKMTNFGNNFQLEFSPGRKSTSNHELHLSEEVTQKLLELQKKGIDLNQLILNALHERAERIEQEKMRLAKEQDEEVGTKLATSRRPPAAFRRLLSEEYGTKCALPYCRKPSENIHHTIAHSIDAKYVEARRGYG